MKFSTTSRKDDLISLYYLTLVILNKHEFPLYGKNFLKDFSCNTDSTSSMQTQFLTLKKFKSEKSLTQLSNGLDNLKDEFVQKSRYYEFVNNLGDFAKLIQ